MSNSQGEKTESEEAEFQTVYLEHRKTKNIFNQNTHDLSHSIKFPFYKPVMPTSSVQQLRTFQRVNPLLILKRIYSATSLCCEIPTAFQTCLPVKDKRGGCASGRDAGRQSCQCKAAPSVTSAAHCGTERERCSLSLRANPGW